MSCLMLLKWPQKQPVNTTEGAALESLCQTHFTRFKKDCRLMDYDDPPYTTEYNRNERVG